MPAYTRHGKSIAARETEGSIMKNKMLLLALAGLTVQVAVAQHAKVTPLVTKEFKNIPGKEGEMIVVDYPPGSSDPIHRHNAQAFVYVLEGSVVMQVKGGKEVTLTPGQTFYEGPNDVHLVGRNASSIQPAKFVVFLVKDKGAPILIPVK
jgi:quercetin dioxygenase-like cupin family protein